MKRLLFFVFVLTGIGASLQCSRERKVQQEFPFQNPDLSIEERVDDLVSRMTLQEKVSQMVSDAPAIKRLGIPKYNWWNECLHGVARAGLATVFPQAIGLAATWDEDFMLKVATVISDEARAKHHEFVRRGKRGLYQGLTFWSPNINIFRDPRWGRGMETYGEDPYLTGRMAVQFIRGLQGDDPNYLKVVATAKHYAVHSGPEPERHSFDAFASERDLRLTYLPHFRAAVVDGRAFSVMCAYNRYRGEACCGSNRLLTEILRTEWGFEGYVVSDCGAIADIYRGHKIVDTPAEAAALAVQAGTDLNCGKTYKSLVEAVEKGLISEDEIDVAVTRLFTARFKLGMFDPPERMPYAKIPYKVVDNDEHKEMALEAARKSIVLLKNENNLLPLKKDLKKIAVIGPNADDVEVLLGNYNGFPSHPITPVQGMRDKVGADKVLYALGCEWAENLPYFEVVPETAFFTDDGPDRKPGLKAEYFDNRNLKGEPKFTRIDKKIDFNWWDGAPKKNFDDDNFGVRWTGVLVPPVSGTYALGAEGFSAFKFYLQDTLLVRFKSSHHPRKTYKMVDLKAGQPYKIKLEFSEFSGDAFIRLLWDVPGKDLHREAMDVAQQADVVVMVMGLSPRLEGEEMKVQVKGFKGGDRLTLGLPDLQEKLIRDVVALGKPVVLVLLNGSALAINWAAEHVPAIVEAWYPGQAAGTAIADVLFGDYNPGGRLPVTFYKSVQQLPPFEDYNMVGKTYRYFEDEPLYPFGFGLSYSRFSYSDLKLPATVKMGEALKVSVTVKNTGPVAGEEVIQLYVTDVQASVPVPIRSLQGFKRISLQPGEKQVVQFTLQPQQLSVIDRQGKRVVEPGEFVVSVGGKQPGFSGRADAATTGVLTGTFKVIAGD